MHISVKRNVTGEMREVIEQALATSGSSYVPSILAVNIVEQLQEEDPELLNKWLQLHATHVVREALVAVERSKRSAARAASERRPGSVFAGAVERYRNGEEQALTAWLSTTYVVSTDNQRKALGDMVEEDLRYTASRYTALSRSHAMQAAFLRALADHVGPRTVSEVFTEQELAKMWRGLA